MPSPFPGMDPYLESTKYWRDVHVRLLTYIADALQPSLLPKYRVRIEEHIHLNSADRDIIPDVLIATGMSHYRGQPLAPAIGVAPDEPLVVTSLLDAPPQRFLEIIETRSGELVTVLEILSPSNKYGDGLLQYRRKIRELHQTETNIVEIDLLGFGEGSFPLGKRKPMRLSSRYSVVVHRYEQPMDTEVYLVPLNQRLPRCRIPLLPHDPDLTLDLPTVFDKCYDNGAYAGLVNYAVPPETTLDATEKAYIDQLLREKGLRQ